MTKSRGRVARRPGPYSERISFGYVLDRRTSEGKFVLAIREQLTQHLGGQLTAPQQLIISAASIKALRLEMMLKSILSEEAIASGNHAPKLRPGAAGVKGRLAAANQIDDHAVLFFMRDGHGERMREPKIIML